MDDTNDPFLSVQSDVSTLLTQTRHLYSSYLRIRTLNPNPNSPELTQSRKELISNLSLLSTDVQDLSESVRAVESDPYTFGLDVAEVSRRKAFIKDVTGEVESMRQEVNDGSQTNISNKRQDTSLPNPSTFETGRRDGDEEDMDEDSDAYAEYERQTQQQMFQQQDEQLDDVFRTVGTLRGQAHDMGRELEEQAVMLDDVDTLADRVGGKLNVGAKKIGEVIRRNEDRYSGCCVAVLIVVLIILLILVIAI